MKYIIITDANVAGLYSAKLNEIIHLEHKKTHLFVAPTGESAKSIRIYEKLLREVSSIGYGKDSVVIGLGGGTIMDLSGFFASTFCRGVPLILVPTTLLAMVDASVGGKTALNGPFSKNALGSFYFPRKIVLHLRFLDTLPSEEWDNGMIEILKMGLLKDADLFYRFSNISIQELVEQAIEYKRRIVAMDPYDQGVRLLLNLGHTIGHAIETVSSYEIPHGRAVSAGIILEARISHQMGLLSFEELEQIENTLFPLNITYHPDLILKAMELDKKNKQGQIHLVLLEKIGKPYVEQNCYTHPIQTSLLKDLLYDAYLCSC